MVARSRGQGHEGNVHGTGRRPGGPSRRYGLDAFDEGMRKYPDVVNRSPHRPLRATGRATPPRPRRDRRRRHRPRRGRRCSIARAVGHAVRGARLREGHLVTRDQAAAWRGPLPGAGKPLAGARGPARARHDPAQRAAPEPAPRLHDAALRKPWTMARALVLRRRPQGLRLARRRRGPARNRTPGPGRDAGGDAGTAGRTAGRGDPLLGRAVRRRPARTGAGPHRRRPRRGGPEPLHRRRPAARRGEPSGRRRARHRSRDRTDLRDPRRHRRQRDRRLGRRVAPAR